MGKGGHTRTGTIRAERDASGKRFWRCRIRLADKSRHWLEPLYDASEAKARDWTRAMQEREDKEGRILAAKRARLARGGAVLEGELARAWFDRYFTWRKAKGFETHADTKARLERYVLPLLASKRMAEITRDDIETIVRALDERVELALEDDSIRFAWKTAVNVWGDVTSAFDEACHSKDRSLRVLTSNPTAGVRGPERGDERAKPFLYPSELESLLACEGVPLHWRRLYAVGAYTAARSNELAALTAGDVDFVHMKIAISKQVDRKTGKVRPTKTRRTRDIDIEMELLPLLRVLVAEAGEGRLLRMPPDEDRAELLRKHLAKAGCTRAALSADDELHSPIVFHGLRDTCLSHMAVRGDSALAIQWRAGHTSFTTTQRYIDAARKLSAGFGTPFPPLPACLLQPTNRPKEGLETEETAMITALALRPQRELNPASSSKNPSEHVKTRNPDMPGDDRFDRANSANTRTLGQSVGQSSRAELLLQLDAATARGDLDEASRLLAQLLLAPEGTSDTHDRN